MPDVPSRAADARLRVRLSSAPLPPHDPLALYGALVAASGRREVFLLESLAGAETDRRSAVVGHGRLAEIRVFAAHVQVAGADALRSALGRAALAAGLRRAPGDGDGGGGRNSGGHGDEGGLDRYLFDQPAPMWDFLARAQALFAVETDVPSTEFAFGFLTTVGYAAAWHMEPLPAREDPERGGPDLTLTLFGETVWYDHRSGQVRRLVATGPDLPPPAGPDVPALAARAAGLPPQTCPPAPAPVSVRDSVDRETFLRWAARCLEHIRVGDIYQIQIGHRIDVTTGLRPEEVYARLRFRNPSPYMYLCPRGDSTLIGASPELHIRIEGDRIVMRPIAGTARRCDDPQENERRVKELLASSKEQAEHVMLVDLCRNDIGRVCRPGTLSEDALMTVEEFSHVFHLVSTVSGRLEPGVTVWQALAATFPAGTMTGAPKLRAMEIIDGLEREPRGIYAGAVGLVDVRGWCELALCIRTVVHTDGTYATQSSAGVVAQSVPDAEWQETLAKMGAAYWALTGEELR
ncbi:anthranilate synthase component I family protein [Streptomyces curacoi]|uniref:Anthranilate synthase n=1 Tax=Streptomyces curacoi TaxID=146536 RepID=A0A117PIZ4_9ACTN|nr:anthranilate synthase component I family protein [Streptomyces curacoi]KUM80494.1 anthranilate synthase [Streptomyces curacoi]